MSKYVILQIKLDALKNFLDHNIQETASEFKEVERRKESDEFDNLDDYENALYHPMMCQEIAARAIYYEINALIESELQWVAYRPWLESEKYSGLKTIEWDNLTEDNLRSLKMVNDLPFREIVKLIEKKYHIKINSLDGSEIFTEIRETVNAFKHRGGFIDFRKQQFDEIKFAEPYQVDVEKAYQAIEQAYVFLKALWLATKEESL